MHNHLAAVADKLGTECQTAEDSDPGLHAAVLCHIRQLSADMLPSSCASCRSAVCNRWLLGDIRFCHYGAWRPRSHRSTGSGNALSAASQIPAQSFVFKPFGGLLSSQGKRQWTPSNPWHPRTLPDSMFTCFRCFTGNCIQIPIA